MGESYVLYIGWVASIMAVLMYVSYIDQIRLNLSGDKGSMIQPVVTTVNCMMWVLYGAMKIEIDWPIIVCNVPGVVLGLITALTSVKGE